MRPYPGTQVHNEDNAIYNYRHSRARRVSENAFGILSQKLRLYYRTINLSPENVDNVILATCCLHNFLRDDPVNLPHEPQPTDLQLLDLPQVGGNFTSSAALLKLEINLKVTLVPMWDMIRLLGKEI